LKNKKGGRFLGHMVYII